MEPGFQFINYGILLGSNFYAVETSNVLWTKLVPEDHAIINIINLLCRTVECAAEEHVNAGQQLAQENALVHLRPVQHPLLVHLLKGLAEKMCGNWDWEGIFEVQNHRHSGE
jgi:hypothetical protein